MFRDSVTGVNARSPYPPIPDDPTPCIARAAAMDAVGSDPRSDLARTDELDGRAHAAAAGLTVCPCRVHLCNRGFARLLSVRSPTTGATLTVSLEPAERLVPRVAGRVVDGRAEFTRAELVALARLADADRKAMVRVGRRVERALAFRREHPRTPRGQFKARWN